MKKSNKILILFSFAFLAIVGCKKDYLDINNDPNNPSEVAPNLVLPAAQSSAAAVVGGELFNLGSIWAQYFTQSPSASQYKREDDYTIKTDYLDRVWQEAYAGALNDLKYVRENGNSGYNLAGAVLQGYIYQVLADAIDKIPYSEALKGKDGVFQPKFDNGEDVYDGILADLNSALETYKGDPTSIDPTTDMIYGGDMDAWVRFANSLKLKIYMRMSNTAKANPAAVTALVGEDMFLLDDAKFASYVDEPNKQNPWYGTNVYYLQDINHRASQTLLYVLLSNDDPRVGSVYKYNAGMNSYLGGLQGDYNNPETGLSTRLSKAKYSATAPVYFMTKYEVSLLLAEAAVKYGVGDAKSLYERGIDENFKIRGLSGASDLYASGGVYEFPTESAAQLEAIYKQKWISMAMLQNYEAWTEIRRTGVPAYASGEETVVGNLMISKTTTLPSGQVPNRLFYPDLSVSRNPNTPGQPSFISEKIWWAK